MISVRAFIGIDFSDELKKYLYDIEQKLKKYAISGRWKNINNFHLTLKFLDEITTDQQKKVNDEMSKICEGRKPFTLEINKLGYFDGRNSIRVLWLGLAGDTKELLSLQKDVDNSLADIGFMPEKRSFKPHITIGQDIVFESGFDEVLKAAGDIKFTPVYVNRLYLFKSEQIQNKRVYTRVSEYELK